MKLLLIPVLISVGFAQVADKANSGYKTPEGREQVARSLIAPDRDAKQKPEELVKAMMIEPGMTVADIGTGAGYMLPFLSRAVGANGWWAMSGAPTSPGWRRRASRPRRTREVARASPPAGSRRPYI